MAKASFSEESLYAWLTDAHSGKSVEQRAAVLRKGKSNRRRRNGAAVQDTEARSMSEVEAQYLRQLLQVSNRRYCRWVNERLLRDLAPPLDADEIDTLFAPPPWGQRSVLTPLERITGAGDNCVSDMAAWEPFRNNVDMDKEAHMLETLSKGTQKEDQKHHTGVEAVTKAWKKVDRQARIALRRHSDLPLLKIFEERIINFIQNDKDGKVLILEVEDKFHRLLLHGICEFYGLSSKTVTETKEVEGVFVFVSRTTIKKKKVQAIEVYGGVRLVDFLKAMKNGLGNYETSS
eukprot:TRINITY_DN9266_c0_g2_i1.p1 TRINITY_DN9266_c0_g2~~TRINITY_DN9266_c0_g2_i1.p1  ORF type:complete len:290 (+),score=56.12 TRINITY_DN9266_c0_g2_i1:264-1133(+)